MKDKFIRVLSPITLAVVAVLDISVVCFSVIAVQKITAEQSLINIAFCVIVFCVLIVAVLVSRVVVTAGVKFDDEKMEFTAVDTDNVFEYQAIQKVEVKRDDKASLTKNFNDRHSYIILHLEDDSVATIDLGLTTKKTLLKIENEINLRMNTDNCK